MIIYLTLDSAYEWMGLSCIYDIIIHSSKTSDITFNILGNGLQYINLFKKFEYFKNVTVNIKNVNLQDYFNIKNFEKKRYLTQTMYLRCIIPECDFSKDTDKVIYTDPDIFVMKNLQEFYNENINEYLAGVIKDFGVHNIWGDKTVQASDYKYFYSGTMLLNIKKLKEFKFTEKCINLIDGNFDDQYIINKILDGRVKYLHPKYCFSYHKIIQGVKEYSDISLWNKTYGLHYQSITSLKNDTVLIHCHGDKEEQKKNPILKKMYDERLYSVKEFLKK